MHCAHDFSILRGIFKDFQQVKHHFTYLFCIEKQLKFHDERVIDAKSLVLFG